MITENELVSKGYKLYDHHGKGDSGYCQGLWQRAIRADAGRPVLYFINLYKWQFPAVWSCEVQLHTEPNCFNLELLIDEHSLDAVEAFYSDAYSKLNCVADKHNG